VQPRRLAAQDTPVELPLLWPAVERLAMFDVCNARPESVGFLLPLRAAPRFPYLPLRAPDAAARSALRRVRLWNGGPTAFPRNGRWSRAGKGRAGTVEIRPQGEFVVRIELPHSGRTWPLLPRAADCRSTVRNWMQSRALRWEAAT